ITIQQVLDLSLALCNALEYLHDVAVPGRIVCHRDLKPDDIGFAQDVTLKLIDFGLGKATHGPVPPPGLGDREKLDEGGGGGKSRYLLSEANGNQRIFCVHRFSACLFTTARVRCPAEGICKERTRGMGGVCCL
ncbi:unnamed protein product, partial [Ectocarpus sp. 6 AP-2014]